ncbi:unnamed protein product, partial [Onchocerca ochengi]|uniref:C2H2-type domain-containing protein n=1 Tax=Onchocerca ochengi TaxID=42157 RepID=A0A182E8W6_ONCOC
MFVIISDDESESDPELREPQVKRRRLLNSSDKKLKGNETSDELEQEINEDIIPFAEEEYESIDCKTMPQTEEEHSWKNDDEMKLNESTSSSTTTITNNCTKIHHHSDIESSWSDNTNFQEVNSHLTWLFPTDVDEQRRQRIQYSPVKSFYKTVPLDETGATDTEVPRISMSDWPAESLGCPTDMHVLTDSLIVNAEEEPEMDSNDDIKEILSMLNDDENGNPKMGRIEKQGTQWREFKYGKTCYPLSFKRNWLLGYVDDDDKHSCDASSEGSDELPTDLNPIIETKTATPPSVLDVKLFSLKRRRKGRLSTSDRFPSVMKISNDPLGRDMENSICSQTWSEIPHLNDAIASLGSIRLPSSHYLRTTLRSKHQVRRKLRARRLPRSMSDGEHLGVFMDTSIHSAPCASMSHWSASNYRDSDTTGPDQSDAPPYEWDDYRPPAKAEDGWDDKDDDREDISVLTIEDDFHMQLGSSHSSFPTHLLHSSYIPDEKKTPTREKTARPVAAVTGKCIRKHSVSPSICHILQIPWIQAASMLFHSYRDTSVNDKLELVKSRTIPLISKLLNSSKSRHFSESDLDNVLTVNNDNTNNSTECIPSFPLASLPQQSLLPIILSKIEKFASSLKLIHHDDSGLDSSFSTLSSI